RLLMLAFPLRAWCRASGDAPDPRRNSIWQPAEAGYPAMSPMANVIGNTPTFVVLFVIMMALTYAPFYPLPPAWNPDSAITGYLVIAVQLAAWALLIGFTFTHGIMIERGWLVTLPLLGMVFNLLVPLATTYFDLVPATHTLSWWLIATVLNVLCLVFAVTGDRRRTAPAPAE